MQCFFWTMQGLKKNNFSRVFTFSLLWCCKRQLYWSGKAPHVCLGVLKNRTPYLRDLTKQSWYTYFCSWHTSSFQNLFQFCIYLNNDQLSGLRYILTDHALIWKLPSKVFFGGFCSAWICKFPLTVIYFTAHLFLLENLPRL